MSDMLQDIIDEWDIEDNFPMCFSRYCNYLEREGKWNLCSRPDRAINNYKYRMRQVHKGKIKPTKEWKKFQLWIDKMASRDQKEAERRAIKINEQWKEKYEKLLEEYNKLKESMN